MSHMKVHNNHFNKILRVSLHAVDRWMQRSSGDIRESLAKAIPFGGQYGSAVMLIDGEIVFVLEQNKWTVVTVLTKDQAIANMAITTGNKLFKPPQAEKREFRPTPTYAYAGGLVAEAPAEVQQQEEKKFPTKRAEESDLMIRFTRLFRLTDEELANELRDTKNNLWRRVCEREQGTRRQITKYKAHAQRMDDREKLSYVTLREALAVLQATMDGCGCCDELCSNCERVKAFLDTAKGRTP